MTRRVESPGGVDDLRIRVAHHMARAREELAELVAIRSVADPRQFPPEECERAANWVAEHFAGVGFADVRLMETPDGSPRGHRVAAVRRPGRPDRAAVRPLRRAAPVGRRRLAHTTVSPHRRRRPLVRQGAADCKGNIVAHLTALRALGDDVPVNLKVVVEGSEEQGTGGLAEFVPGNADLLRADVILIADSGNAAVGRPGLTVSLRGVVDAVVSVEALTSALHCGIFGGAAPDSLAALVVMLAGPPA